MLGADVSSLTKSEDLGGVYFDDAARLRSLRATLGPRHPGGSRREPRPPARVGRPGGRLPRPSGGAWRWPGARRASGLKVLVDLHYSDTWADPGHQTKPAAWASYSTEQLRQAVYDHTFDVCRSLKRHGHGPDMIQLGNELNSGMLWPDGHTWDPPNWDNLAGFLTAGYDAVKACSPSTQVMLHLANGGDNGLYRWWFDNITSRGVPFDVIGASYYGYWHGSLGDLQWNLNDVSARYGKDVVVAETAYPFTLGFDDNQSNVIGLREPARRRLPRHAGGPGAKLPRRAVDRPRRAERPRPRRLLLGRHLDGRARQRLGSDRSVVSGNAWENQALFDFDDLALPALDELRP